MTEDWELTALPILRETSGIYKLQVSSGIDGAIGSYQVKVAASSLPSDDVGNSTNSARLLDLGEKL